MKNKVNRAITVAALAYGAYGFGPISSAAQDLAFQEKSSVLGGENIARTKDAHVADVNGDGFLDILDANSNNTSNQTDVILRLNDRNGGFSAVAIGPRDDSTSYDADLVDLNGDGLPDLVRAEGDPGPRQASIYLNRGMESGWFDLANPDFVEPMAFCPDDISYGDLNGDGFVDLAVAQRLGGACHGAVGTSTTSILINDGTGSSFTRVADLPAPNGVSTHDVFFLDANGDGVLDVVTVNESGPRSQLWINDGATTPSFSEDTSVVLITGFTGEAADLNADGLNDFVLAGSDRVLVYLNQPPGGSFIASTNLPNALGAGAIYDVELGDLDVDGQVDIAVASIGGQIRIWLNDGSGDFTSFGGVDPLPGHVPNQRLSIDLLDFDRDGDLDLYVAGGDSQNLGCYGCVPNQFFENVTDPVLPASVVTTVIVPFLLDGDQ